MIKKTLSFFILLFIIGSLYAQTPFMRNFSREEYKASGQNWSIVQNQQGIMYFANTLGLLEYDGTNWRHIATPYMASSLCIDSTGVIYTGCDGDFGYLDTDSIGRLQYVSLKDKIPPEHVDFKEVWQIYTLGNRVIFRTPNKLFVLQNDRIDVLHSASGFGSTFVVYNRFYIEKKGEGLYFLENNTLRLLPCGENFQSKSVWAMLPYENEDILIATRDQGIFIYNPNKSPLLWKPEGFETVDDFLKINKTYCGTLLYNGHFAIGSRIGGILIFDKRGKIKNHYNKQNGLQSNTSYYLFTDLYGQLWVALEDGISLIMPNLPFLYYTHENGLDGSVYSIQKFKNKLYVGTSNNLYVQNEENNFERIEGTTGQNFFLLEANETLVLGNHPNGIFEIKNNKALQSKALILPSVTAITLRKHPNYIIAQVWNRGLALIEYKNEQWLFKHFIKGFDKNARYIEEDDKGNFWLNANSQLYKLRLNETLDSVVLLENCTAEQYHLPETSAMPYRLNDGEIIFGSEEGIYRYLADKNYFEPHPKFPMFPEGVYNLNQAKNGIICFEEQQEGSEKGVLRLIDGKYEKVKTPFLKFTENVIPNTSSIYPYSDSLLYFGTNKGLLEYHPQKIVNYDKPFFTLIRKVFVKDSLIYAGTANVPITKPENKVKLKYQENNLIFHYSATFYENSEKNLFSYRLIGSSDTTWSAWTNDHKKEYTNLFEGKYVFEVRSQNIYRKYGKTASFAFKILPPWQRTWWAYAVYGILAFVFVGLLIRLNSARLKRLNELLTQTVKERTAELQSSNKKLIELDHFKEGMTGMIVHDLKNPLNTIIGLSEKPEIKQAGKQMLNMVLNILDVQKFEDTEVKLQMVDFLATKVINDSIKQVQLLIDRKSIKVEQNINPTTSLRADIEIVNRVIVNILTNAIKYTPNNGSVTINAAPENNSNFVKISITDTGEGIPQDSLAKVFDKFSQVEAKKSGGVASTGLGLTFCKLAIEAHGGEIGVESEEKKGTTFWFLLNKAEETSENNTISESSTNAMIRKVDYQLSNADRRYLKPFVESLRELTVYEFSDVITILEIIETKGNSNLFAWRIAIENAIRSCNETKYEELINVEINK